MFWRITSAYIAGNYKMNRSHRQYTYWAYWPGTTGKELEECYGWEMECKKWRGSWIKLGLMESDGQGLPLSTMWRGGGDSEPVPDGPFEALMVTDSV